MHSDLLEKILDNSKNLISINDVIDFILHGDFWESSWDNVPDQDYVKNSDVEDLETQIRLSLVASFNHYRKSPEGSELGRFLKRRNENDNRRSD